jgi:uncharacterized protein YfaT (DUF1175 family)
LQIQQRTELHFAAKADIIPESLRVVVLRLKEINIEKYTKFLCYGLKVSLQNSAPQKHNCVWHVSIARSETPNPPDLKLVNYCAALWQQLENNTCASKTTLRLFRKNCELTLGKGQQKWLIKQSVTE